jgi:hypothetical protein
VIGFASTSSILAIISDPIELHAIFVGENQRLLLIENWFTMDQDVMFYHVSEQNPLGVLKNLGIQSASDGSSKKRKNDGMECEVLPFGFSRPCVLENAGLKWDEAAPKAKALTYSPLPKVWLVASSVRLGLSIGNSRVSVTRKRLSHMGSKDSSTSAVKLGGNGKTGRSPRPWGIVLPSQGKTRLLPDLLLVDSWRSDWI